jgi:N-methylhydantoinase B
MNKPDIITAEVIRNGLIAAAQEMGTTLVRTAYNPLLYDVQDYGLAIVSADCETWAEAPGMTVFVGALPHTVGSGIAVHGIDGFEEGDVIIANDPYTTGNHISDVSIYMPVFFEGKLLAFTASVAHWADIGGKTPGGWCPDSVDVYQEGICFAHEKVMEAGKEVKGLWGVIKSNTRYPDIVIGDMQAQIASCRQGAERLQKLCSKYGFETVRDSMSLAIDSTEQDTRRHIREIPNGTYEAQQMMDHDGVIAGVPFPINIQLRIEDEEIHVSFTGTSEMRAGPVNAPEYAVRSVVRAAIKGVISPTEASNEGDFLPIKFDIPPGLVISPQRPAPVDSYGYVCIAAYELCMRAMSKAIPERCIAGGATLCMPTISRFDPRDGQPFILSDPFDVGNGARPNADAPTMAINVMGDVPNSPTEVVEMRYPLRIERFGLRTEVSGHGEYRGGAGIYRDYRVLEDGVTLFSALENTQETIAEGADAGGDGGPAQVVINPDENDEMVLNDRGPFPGILKAGDVISMRSGGGGGWGHPSSRDPEQVVADVRDERISIDEARDIYKVAVDNNSSCPVLNVKETNVLRTNS